MAKLPRRTVLAGAAALALAPRPAASADTPKPIAVRRGINLFPWFSLTTEYPAPRRDYAWPPFQASRPVPRRADLERLAGAGFDFVRIPVDPGPFLAFEDDRREQLLTSLDEAVALCLDAGLSVVVCLAPNAATHYWRPETMVASTGAPEFPKYALLAADVAARLAKHDVARLALELVNEPPQSCGAQAWLDVQDALFAGIRAAAPGLTIVATGSCGSMIAGLEKLSASPLHDDGPTLFTFHFYEPYLFTHQGAPWVTEPVYRDLNAVPWPASAGSLETTLTAVRMRMAADPGRSQEEKAEAYAITERLMKQYFDADPDIRFIERYFQAVEAWRKANGVAAGAILLGEFGALRSDARYVASAAPDRARYSADVRKTAETFGYAWAYFNLFDGFSIYADEDTRVFDPAILAALGL